MMINTDSKYIRNLIDAAQKGNKNSFMQLVELHLGNIYLLSLRLLNDKDIAEKVTKDIFVHSWQNIKQVRSDASFCAWLKGIAVFKNLQEIHSNNMIETSTETGSESKLYYSKKKIEVQISDLEKNERVAYILHDVEGYSYSEVSDLLQGTDEQSIIELVHYVRQTLAKEF